MSHAGSGMRPTLSQLTPLTAVCLFQVEFSSLDFLLHTKALLSTINYLTSALPLRPTPAPDIKKQEEMTRQGQTGECTCEHHR